MFISMPLSRALGGPWGLGLGLVVVTGTTFAALWWWPSIGLSGDSRAFFDEFDDADTRRWERSDGWSNGDWVGCSWRADNVVFEDGEMTLVLDDKGGRDHDLACGEYRTRATYHYGRYEVSMKAARGDGVVTAFFLYTGPAFDTAWHETTIEILGRDTTEAQFTLFVGGESHPSTVDLGFDAAEEFHTYAIEWAPDEVRWYVDDRLLHVDSAPARPVPALPGRIYVSLWNGGHGLEDWLGEFDYGGTPIEATYDWIRHTPLALED